MGCERFFGCNRSFETFPNAMRASCFLELRDDRIFVFFTRYGDKKHKRGRNFQDIVFWRSKLRPSQGCAI